MHHSNSSLIFDSLWDLCFITSACAFLADVVANGASAVLVSEKTGLKVRQIVVPDTLLALAYIGAYSRAKFKGRVVGLTGSAGKTSSKEMLVSVLGEAGRVLATKGNLNNEIGVDNVSWLHGLQEYFTFVNNKHLENVMLVISM